MGVEAVGEDPEGVNAQIVLQGGAQHGGGGAAFSFAHVVITVVAANRGHLIVVVAVVGTVGRGGRNAAEMFARGGHRVGQVAVFRAAFAHDAADVIAVAAIDRTGIVAVLNGVGISVDSHHTTDVVVYGLGTLRYGDATGVETAQSAGQIAADAADVAAFGTARDVARIGAVDHHTAVTDNATGTVGGDVGAAAHVGDDVRIVDTIADGVATGQRVVLGMRGQ